VKLFENPIFLTHKRLVHRGGVLAAILIAALIGFSLLAGLISYLADPADFHFSSPQEAGKIFYGWTIGVEILVLVVGGFSRIARALADDRKAGLWDSNRLTPLKPSQLVVGYWFGPALREFYMAAVLAGFGLLIVLAGRLPLTLWLGTQTLIASTALFFGLLGILAGMAFQRSQGILIFLVLLCAYPFSFIAPSRMLTNFLLPIYGIGNLFHDQDSRDVYSEREWGVMPEIFGIHAYPILLSLGLQLVVGIFVWRALVRKTAHPFQPLLLRWEAVALFIILIASQHALMWDLWNGQFPRLFEKSPDERIDNEMLLTAVHGGTIATGILLLALASPLPERVRVESLRLGFNNLGSVFSRSAVSLALVLAAVASAAMLTQFMFSLAGSFQIFCVTTISLAEIFLVFALLLEFCRLRFKRRALGFVALWLFIICIIPFILAGVFSSEYFARISLLSPGFIALSDESDPEWPLQFRTVLAHFGIVVILFIAWQRQWKRLLAKTS
jgi:hypothetical protein